MLPSNVECPIGEVAGATPEGKYDPLKGFSWEDAFF